MNVSKWILLPFFLLIWYFIPHLLLILFIAILDLLFHINIIVLFFVVWLLFLGVIIAIIYTSIFLRTKVLDLYKSSWIDFLFSFVGLYSSYSLFNFLMINPNSDAFKLDLILYKEFQPFTSVLVGIIALELIVLIIGVFVILPFPKKKKKDLPAVS